MFYRSYQKIRTELTRGSGNIYQFIQDFPNYFGMICERFITN